MKYIIIIIFLLLPVIVNGFNPILFPATMFVSFMIMIVIYLLTLDSEKEDARVFKELRGDF